MTRAKDIRWQLRSPSKIALTLRLLKRGLAKEQLTNEERCEAEELISTLEVVLVRLKKVRLAKLEEKLAS